MFTKTDATSIAGVPGTEVATCSGASTESYIPSCCFRDRGCYMLTKTEATSPAAVAIFSCTKTDASLADVPGTEGATCSLKLMLHP